MSQTFSVMDREVEGLQVLVPSLFFTDEAYAYPYMIKATLSFTVVVECGEIDAKAITAYMDFISAPASIRFALHGDAPEAIDLGNIILRVRVPHQLGGEVLQDHPLSALIYSNEQAELFG